jgi:hypothetical protein
MEKGGLDINAQLVKSPYVIVKVMVINRYPAIWRDLESGFVWD